MRDSYDIIKTLRVTEKGTALAEKHNQYVLRVAWDATKQEIRRAVEEIFKKRPLRVNTLRVTGKKKRERLGRLGRRSNWKKAIVTLKPGEKIELV